MEQGINRDIESVRNLAESSGGFYNAARKTRNRYIKWSQEEDDLLAQVRFAPRTLYLDLANFLGYVRQ